MIFSTKSYAERLEAAIKESDKKHDPEQAVLVLKQALQKEIKTVRAMEAMPAFRAWLDGERFDLNHASARKK